LFPCMQNLTHWQEAKFLLLTLVLLLSAWHIVPQVGILWLQSSRLDRPELLFSEYEDILLLYIEIVFCWFFHYDSLVDSISNKTGAEADKINILFTWEWDNTNFRKGMNNNMLNKVKRKLVRWERKQESSEGLNIL
jgi:hypothetical protein